jgi:hypothetical protein
VRRPTLRLRLVTPVVCAVLVAASTAWAQGTVLRPGIDPFRRPTDPQALVEPRRAPITLTPTLTVGEEYNDNVFLDNDNREWDLVTFIAPGLALEVESPTYRLAAHYSFTSEIYARHPDLSDAFNRHNLGLDAFWRVTPRLTLTAFDTLVSATDTNLVTAEGVETGRDRALSNALGAGASYALDPRTTVRGGASWSFVRFERGTAVDSDTYRVDGGIERAFTPRLRGVAEYEFNHFTFDTPDLGDAQTHTARVGAVYRITETLTGALRLGPTFEVDGGTHVTPSVIAALTQRTRWGDVGLNYTRIVGTAGALGGTTRNDSVGALVRVTALLRGLVLEAGPRFSHLASRDDRIDVQTFTLPVQASWRFAQYAAVVAGYRFFHQRSESRVMAPAGPVIVDDVDQNRVWIGLQVGYPIRFD